MFFLSFVIDLLDQEHDLCAFNFFNPNLGALVEGSFGAAGGGGEGEVKLPRV